VSATGGNDANDLHAPYLATAPADSSRRNAMKAETSREGVDGAVEGTAAEKAVKEVAADVRRMDQSEPHSCGGTCGRIYRT
jgi:hypothetical protein